MLGLLRRGPRTVEELASALGFTDNAIRLHLSALERDGLIFQESVRRRAAAGKPAVVFAIHPDTELLFSRAYAPVLCAMLDELSVELSSKKGEQFLRAVGRRLARELPNTPTPNAAVAAEKCVALLRSLGGEPEIQHNGETLIVQSSTACPLALAVKRNPDLCNSLETLLCEVAHASIRSVCDHGDRPRCRFEVQFESIS